MRRSEQPGLVVRQKSPLNLEYQFSTLADWLVPTEQFYVRSHFAAPELDEVHMAAARRRRGGNAAGTLPR